MSTIKACVILCLLVLGVVNSCPSPFYLKTNVGSGLCARMYQHDQCSGDYLDTSTSYNSNIGENWNDKITSLVVLPKCELQVYEHHRFEGDRFVFGHYSQYGEVVRNIGDKWNDKITSFICTCKDYKK